MGASQTLRQENASEQQDAPNTSDSCEKKVTRSRPNGEQAGTDTAERSDSGFIDMPNSKDKGARYEREIANILKTYGYDARRSAQYCGKSEESADVVGVPHIHIECKHYANRAFDYSWMEQSIRDAHGKVPVVIHRTDNKYNLVTMRLDDFIDFAKAYEVIIQIGEALNEE